MENKVCEKKHNQKAKELWMYEAKDFKLLLLSNYNTIKGAAICK